MKALALVALALSLYAAIGEPLGVRIGTHEQKNVPDGFRVFAVVFAIAPMDAAHTFFAAFDCNDL